MSLFTVEQLELIRRLRTTGITAQQVVEAFEQMEQIDSDLKKPSAAEVCPVVFPSTTITTITTSASSSIGLPTSPTSTSSSGAAVVLPTTSAADDAITSPILLQHLKAQAPVPVTISASSPALCPSPDRISVQTVPPPSSAEMQLSQQLSQIQSAAVAALATSSSATLPPASPPSGSTTISAMSAAPSMQLPKYENHSGGRPIRSQRTPINDIIVLDDPSELEEFMEQGEEGCICDMKQFINQYSLRQTTVAMMTGVSQPYISKLLNGNHRELSLRCRKNIYCWYLNCRKHPEKLASFLSDPSTRLETNGDGELIPQRRERYVFRPVLIRMLENFFAQTPFPDLNRRIEIATACNHMLQLDKKGVGLMPKEVVSPQVVANWFANKRKEIRRKSQENQENRSQMASASSAPAQSSTPLHDEGSSGCTSTPSPSMEDTNMSELNGDRTITDVLGFNNTQPLDMMALASRLGFQIPTLPTLMYSSPTRSVSPEVTPNTTSVLSNSTPTSSTTLPPTADSSSLESIASQLLNNSQVSLATSLAMLHPTLGLMGSENGKAQFDLGNLAVAYDQLRSPLVKLEQPLFKMEQRIE